MNNSLTHPEGKEDQTDPQRIVTILRCKSPRACICQGIAEREQQTYAVHKMSGDHKQEDIDTDLMRIRLQDYSVVIEPTKWDQWG